MVYGLILLTGCNTIQDLVYKDYSKKSEVQKEISALETKHRQDVDSKVKDIQSKLEKTIESQDKQLQESANKLYAADETFKYYVQPTRIDRIINNRVTEAWAAIGKYPSYQAIKDENTRILKELDEKITSLDQLMLEHQKVLEENKQLVQATDKAKKDAETAKTELANINTKYQTDSGQLQGKLNAVNDEIQHKQKEALDNKEAIERMKTKLMIGCGIAAALCIVGAVYSPVGKGSLAICAAVFGGAAAAIPFIEGWMILVAVLVIAAIIAIVFLYKHNIAEKTTDNLINHIQDIKENPDIPEDVKKLLRDNLSQWNSKYVGDKITQADGAVENYIKSKLKDYGRL
jgi:hypothetical protein